MVLVTVMVSKAPESDSVSRQRRPPVGEANGAMNADVGLDAAVFTQGGHIRSGIWAPRRAAAQPPGLLGLVPVAALLVALAHLGGRAVRSGPRLVPVAVGASAPRGPPPSLLS